MKPLDALINEGQRPATFGLHLMGAFDTAAPEQWDESRAPNDHRMVAFRRGTRSCAVPAKCSRVKLNLWQPEREARLKEMKENRLRNARRRAEQRIAH